MVLPGPSGFGWALSLLGYGVLLGLTGESIRFTLENRISLFRSPDWLERALVDVYLGVGALYLVAALPGGLFYPATPIVLAVLVGACGVAVFLRRRRRQTPPAPRPGRWGLSQVVAALAAVALFGIELAVAQAAGAGNTFDSALYATYTGLLGSSHSLPWNLSPVVAVANPFPQGATAVFGGAQFLAGLPPPRSALLVTPLFFALAPLAGYVWGRRWLGSPAAGAAFALVVALLATWTRTMAAGSNDFVLAFPLLLLLLAWATTWWDAELIDLRNTLGFGGLVGICAVLSPVGPVWLMLTVLVGAFLFRPRFSGRPGPWLSRWAVAVGTSVVLLVPSLVALLLGPSASSAGFPPPGTETSNDPLSTFVGYVNPFLFGPNDQLLSPFPLLRAELALLIVTGAVLLLFARQLSVNRPAARWFGLGVLAAILVAVAELAVETWSPLWGAPYIRGLSSPSELAILLFAVYTAIATYPLALLLMRRPPSPVPTTTSGHPRRVRSRRTAAVGHPRAPVPPLAAALVALLLLAPGMVVTATVFPTNLAQTYTTFGNVTEPDYDLLTWASDHLPAGARVLVAPGSAGQFLPGYNPALVPVFPVLVVGESTNASYQAVVGELTNGTLEASGVTALRVLAVQYIIVTQQNTVLWPPFQAAPLISSPRAQVAFHEGDAWLFTWDAT